MTLFDSLVARGFDQSYRKERDDAGRFSKAVRVRCSQCEALVINGLACHETRCPNGRQRDEDED
jgi:hypothetical protein